MFNYNATLHKIVDADTIDLIVDLGFHITICERFRLANINAAERNTQLGKDAIKFAAEWFVQNSTFVIQSIKPIHQEKYGRWLAIIRSNDLLSCLNDLLVANAYAVPYMEEV
jgi:endonuclease YncB( thermonuclease family)